MKCLRASLARPLLEPSKSNLRAEAKKSTPAARDLKFEALNLPLDSHPWGSGGSPFSTIVSAPPP